MITINYNQDGNHIRLKRTAENYFNIEQYLNDIKTKAESVSYSDFSTFVFHVTPKLSTISMDYFDF